MNPLDVMKNVLGFLEDEYPNAPMTLKFRDAIAELESLVASVEKERDDLSAKVTAWEEKAATWMASPEAAKRLEGYRELAQQLNEALQQLAACQTEAISLRKALIRWRQREWPETDQAAVVNKEFPVTAQARRRTRWR